MVAANTDFGRVADDLRRAATSFALLATQASLLGRSLQAFREFEKQLILTNAIAQGTEAQFRQMSDAARQFALVTTASAVEAGQALQQLAQAGFTAEESLTGLAGVLLLSQATMTDVGVAADVMSSNIRAFGLETSDTTRIANLFTAAITGSLATMDKLVFAMRQVAPVSDVAGLSIEQTTAFLGELFNIGLRGEQAGTSLRNVIVRLIRPTGEAAGILREYGISTLDLTGNFRGLEAVLKDLAAANLGEAQLAKIFENEALAGAIRLLKVVSNGTKESASSFQKLLKEITGTDRALIITLKNIDTFDGSMQLLSNSLNDAAITIGEALAPFIQELGDFVRDVIKDFNELDDSTKANIASWLGYSTAVAGVLAVTSSLILLFKIMASVIFTQLLPRLLLLGSSLINIVPFAAKASGALTTLTASFAGVGAAKAVAGLLTLTAGVAGIAIVAAAATYGLSLLFNSASDLDRLNISLDIEIPDVDFGELSKFDQGISIAKRVANAVGTDSDFAEAEERISLAQRLIDSDIIRLFTAGDFKAAISAAQSAQTIVGANVGNLADERVEFVRELARGLGVSTAEFERQATNLKTAVDNFEEAETALDGAFLLFGKPTKARADAAVALRNITVGTDKDIFAALRILLDFDKKQLGVLDETTTVFDAAKQEEVNSWKKLLNAVKDGDSELDTAFEDIGGVLSTALSGSGESEASAGLLDFIQNFKDSLGGGELTANVESELNEILQGDLSLAETLSRFFAATEPTDTEAVTAILVEGLSSGVAGINVDTIAAAYIATQKDVIIKAFGSLEGANEALDVTLAQSRANLARAQAKITESVSEAIELEREASALDLRKSLTSISNKVRTDYDKIFSTIDFNSVEGLGAALDASFADIEGFDLGTEAPAFAYVITGEWLTDSILSQVDKSTTSEEILAIAEVERAKLEAIMAAYAGVLMDSPLVSDALRAELLAFGAGSAELAVNIVQQGMLGLQATIGTIEKRAGSSKGKGGGGGGSKIPKVIQDARKLEDAFFGAAKAATDANRAFFEAFRGFDLGSRETILLDLDIQDITNAFDSQLSQVQRKLEDAEFNLGGNAELVAQYQETILVIEATRDAEIAAANSFTAQMERRSDAIDLYIRDLKDLSIAQDDAFTQAGAGMAAAFAEFNREIITVFDIVQSATLDFTESISSSLADVIYEGENLFEAFASTLLDISRQVFENFTNAFLQSITEGLSSGDGLLGGLLSKLGLGAGGAVAADAGGAVDSLGGGAQTAQITAATAQLSTALTTGAAQIQSAFSVAGPSLSTALTTTATSTRTSSATFNSAFGPALQSVIIAIETAGAAAAAKAGGGGGGFLSNILGLAGGGQVFGEGTGTSDSILALLSNNEYVVNSDSTKRYLPLLQAINSGQSPDKIFEQFLSNSPRLSDGGFISNSNVSSLPTVNLTGANNSAGLTVTDTATPNKDTGGIVLNVTYNIRGGDSNNDVDELRRSTAQHAKELAGQLGRAKKNT